MIRGAWDLDGWVRNIRLIQIWTYCEVHEQKGKYAKQERFTFGYGSLAGFFSAASCICVSDRLWVSFMYWFLDSYFGWFYGGGMGWGISKK